MKIRGESFEEDIDQELDEAEEQVVPLMVDDLAPSRRDDDDDDDEGLSRRDRRERRGQERRGEREELQQELAKRDQQLAEMKGQLDVLTRLGSQQAQPQMSAEDAQRRIDQHLEGLEARMEETAMSVVTLENQKASAEEIQAAKRRYYSANREYQQFNAQVAHARMAPPPVSQEQQAEQARWQRLTAMHADVLSDNRARALTEAELKRMSADRPQGWKPNDDEIRQATDKVRQELGLGRYADIEPTAHQRRATSGYASSTGGARARGSDPAPMTEADKAWAVAWYDEVVGEPATDAHKVRMYQKHVMSSERG